MIVTVFFGSASAQNWKFAEVFPQLGFMPGPLSASGINNAITVDPMGRVWLASFHYGDSISTSSGYIQVKSIYCLNPNGSQASFSPLHILTNKSGTISDTLNYPRMDWSYSYGMRTGPDGNIYFIQGDYIIELNYHDGTVLQQVEYPIPGFKGSLASCAIDSLGEVFVVPVISGPGPNAISSDFSSVAATIDTSAYGGVARTIEVSPDGNDVYVPYFAGAPGSPCVYHYNSSSGTLGTYTLADTLFKGMAVESMAWQPGTGYLWVGDGGTATNPSAAGSGWTPFSWYGFDMTNPSKPVLKDSITWNLSAVGINADSAKTTLIDDRGIAFSPTGDTVYVAMFNTNTNCIQMFVNTATPVVERPNTVPTSYSLSQNYPNPFNPTTRIDYALKATGNVSLKVYDVLGREVATLVNGVQAAGQHSVTFNASNFASGMYFYSLTTPDGLTVTKKMILMK